MKSILILACVITLITVFNLSAQNIAITDDDSYVANSSAMLDVKSLTKGLLVPRLTSLQRLAIVSPATGLLVFDSTFKQFLYYNGTTWLNLLTPEGDTLWNVSANSVSLANPLWNMGVGSTNPVAKLEVKGDSLAGIDDPLFAVVNKNGDTVFAVYQEGVRIYVNDGPAKATGSKGGFAVGGFSPAKGAVTNQYLHISPDSIRLYVEDVPTTKASGSKGGFAVGGFSPAKAGVTNEYFRVTSDSTRIYTTDTLSGFGVESLGAGTSTSYMRLTPSNYFIGHQAGDSITSGKYNSFFGYQCGLSNKGGNYNVFSGYKSGLTNTGSDNTFIGFEAGSSHQGGGGNVYLGSKAGQYDVNGTKNIFIGEYAGWSNTTGSDNVCLGYSSGKNNSYGTYNVLIGNGSGFSNTIGDNNIFLGFFAGYNNTTGNRNTANGQQVLYSNTEGSGNVAYGYMALYKNSTGNNNVSMGYGSLFSNTIGTNNTAVGNNSFTTGDSYSNSTTLGANSNMTASNKVRIGNASVTVIEGQVAYSFPSDSRFKNNAIEEVKGLEFISKLRPVVYNFDTRKYDEFLMKDMSDSLRKVIMSQNDYSQSSGIRQSGFIAQEVEQAAKETGYDFNGVHKPVNENDNYSVAYSLFTVPLVKAVQEQQQQIEQLKTENALLKSKISQIDELRATNNSLKASIEKINKLLEISAKK